MSDTLSVFAEEHFPSAVAEIARLRNDIKIKTTGAPSTEAISPTPTLSHKSEELSNAEQEVLNATWRRARSILHPDRGGNAEDFNAAMVAFKTGDLPALIETVLSCDKSEADQLEHWRTQLDRAHAQMIQLRASAAYTAYVAVKYQAPTAKHLVSSFLQQLQLRLYQELLRN